MAPAEAGALRAMIPTHLNAKVGVTTDAPSGKGSTQSLSASMLAKGDIRRWFVASPREATACPWEATSQSFEAAHVAEGHDRGNDAPLSAENAVDKDSEWIVVSSKRRQRLGHRDSRSVVLWGVPHSESVISLSNFLFLPLGKIKRDAMTIDWHTTSDVQETQERFVLATFRSAVDREAHYKALSEMCAGRGWKALRSRSYLTRNQQRNTAPKKANTLAKMHKERGSPALMAVLDDPMVRVLSGDAQAHPVPAEPEPQVPLTDWEGLTLGSLNVQGNLKLKIAELEAYLSKRRYDIVALQEVRGVEKLTSKGFRYYGSVNEDNDGGVGFLVALHLDPLVTRLKSRFKNQLWLKIRGTAGCASLYLCSAYMPQETAPVIERTAAWDGLLGSARSYRSKGEVVLAGDLNARLGLPTRAEEERALGPFAAGTTSGNGRLLLKLLTTLRMKSLAGFWKPPTREGWKTRTDPATGNTSQIDFLLVQQVQPRRSEFSVDYTSLDTDHHLLRARITCPRKLPKRRKSRKVHRFLVEKLREKPIDKPREEREATPAEEYQDAISLEFGEEWEPAEVAASAEGPVAAAVLKDFLGKMNAALEKSVGSKTVSKKFSRPWYDKEVKAAIDQRRDAFKIFKASTSRQNWNKYSELRRAARDLVRQKQRKDWEKLMESLGADLSQNPKRMWSKVKRVIRAGKSNTGSTAVKKTDGSLAISEVDRREAWADYMHKLGQPLQSPSFDQDFATETEALVARYAQESEELPEQELDKDFTDDELITALGKLKYYKACSFDQVRNEALKEGGKELRSNLLKLFNWINSTEEVPKDWATSLVVMLYKDGDETDPANYRGISLISCLGKLYLSMWTQRLTAHLDPRLAEEQGGFRAKRSTVDQLFVFNETLLRQRRAGRTTHCFFIDFRKAFDTVWHQGLWRRLWEEGIQGKAWRILRSLYSDLQSSVLVEGEPSRTTPLKQGVRQGCPLSPILFSCYINDLVRRLKELGYGVSIGDRDLTALLYADDIVLMTNSASEMQALIDEVDKFCAEWRLDLNSKKSQIMVVAPNGVPSEESDSDDEPKYVWRGKALEVVSEYKYLGVIVTNKLLWDRHISMIVDKGKAALDKQRCLLAQRQVPMKIKRLVLTAMVRSKLEYASPVWYGNTQHIQALESIQHAGCVWILRTNQKANVTALRTILGLPSLQTRRTMLRLFYASILLSKSHDTWPRHCLETEPSNINRVLGISQNHWRTRFSDLIDGDSQLKEGYQALLRHMAVTGGVLQDYSLPKPDGTSDHFTPVKDWRSLVRRVMTEQEVACFRIAAGNQPTLAVLACSTDESLSRVQNLTKRSSHPANWIRIRLLAGTSSLNVTMSRITRGQRSQRCPVCEDGNETVLHFLCECQAPSSLVARNRHIMKVTELFEGLTPLQQCAFILGCEVETESKPVAATREEDLASKELVETLWEHRCAALTRSTTQDLTVGTNLAIYVRRNHPKSGGSGVEAHGNATLSI